MSQLATAPETNPTTPEIYPLQKMKTESTGQMITFGTDPTSMIRSLKPITTMQLDLQKLAQKDKIKNTFTWTVGSTDDWLSMEFDIRFVKNLTKLMEQNFAYFNFSGLFLTIRPVNNAFYQGKTWVIFDNSPIEDFYQRFYGINFNLFNASQFERFDITPNDSLQIQIEIPINCPFNRFRNEPSVITPGAEIALEQTRYLDDYVFGRLRSFVPVTLQTNADNRQNLKFPVSARLGTLSIGGTNLMT